jgi:hypothetical protein
VNNALIAVTLREAGWRLTRVPSFASLTIPAIGALGSVALMLASLN